MSYFPNFTCISNFVWSIPIFSHEKKDSQVGHRSIFFSIAQVRIWQLNKPPALQPGHSFRFSKSLLTSSDFKIDFKSSILLSKLLVFKPQ